MDLNELSRIWHGRIEQTYSGPNLTTYTLQHGSKVLTLLVDPPNVTVYQYGQPPRHGPLIGLERLLKEVQKNA